MFPRLNFNSKFDSRIQGVAGIRTTHNPAVMLAHDKHGSQLAKTGYHTRLIHFVQYLMEKSVCMVSEGLVEPVDG